jgi:hypothetical protein
MYRALISLLLLGALSRALAAESSNIAAIRDELPSPDGKREIVVFYRLGGTNKKTIFTLHASVLNRAGPLPDNEMGNIFILDEDPDGASKGYARVFWKKDGRILVVFTPPVYVLNKASSVDGIEIEYREENGEANKAAQSTTTSVTPPAGQEARQP